MRVYVVYQYVKEVQTPEGIQALGGMASEEVTADVLEIGSIIELGKDIQKRRKFASLTVITVIPLPLKAASSILLPSGILQ